MSEDANNERELPHNHLYQVLLPTIFIIIWFLDSQLFQFSTILNQYVPLVIRFIGFALILVTALFFIYSSHQAIFKSNTPSNTLIREGVFKYTRNPMYFGILLIYISLIALSLSLVSIGVFFFVFLAYNKIADYEGTILEDLFGDEYVKYKSEVSKWIPLP
ncbi:MAG: DUF1295 domain-containing protein [Candidatus Lokiarchaeota archaeon]|nr:DUF1295 domain-containing protein [Candidatus Lokiarchaeota archaeon]MBD3201048.1 DUF1295 domain-containing protein [Candidatus Lokiarchaeota archaeon]